MLNGGRVSEKMVAVVTVNALCLDLLAVYDNAAVLYLNSSCADGESDVLVSAVESESIEVGFFVRPELCVLYCGNYNLAALVNVALAGGYCRDGCDGGA